MFPPEIVHAAERLLAAAQAQGLWLATAESCTGGLIAGCLTAVSGSSSVVDRGVVTYSNQAKVDLLGVPDGLIARHGAVSREVAHAMAEGLLARSRADIALSVTGIAGPGGGSLEKPVGLVYLGCARRDQAVVVERHVFPGDREAVRLAAVARSLAMGLAATAHEE